LGSRSKATIAGAREYGGLKLDQAKRFKDLERENERLKKAVSELPFLNGEIFTTLREAQVLIENWRRHYNAVRPHSSLNYRPPLRIPRFLINYGRAA
jgi:transposase InsO family protein